MDIAETIAPLLIEERLAAYVHILPQLTSIYRLDHSIHKNHEILLIAKTVQENMEKLGKVVRKEHPFDCPCIISMPVNGGERDFLNWIIQETTGDGENRS